jgi:hypothetical protein
VPCITLRDQSGKVIGHACVRGSRSTRCQFCRKNSVSLLCDYPTRPGKQCSKGMCDECATHVTVALELSGHTDTIDYCPNHKHFATAQQELFA